MSIKIQINSLEALERLIGGEAEMEVSIRNSVVQQFSETHLKSLVNSSLMKDTANAVANEIKAEFFETITTNQWGNKQTLFSPAVKEKLKNSLMMAARRELAVVVNEALEEVKHKEYIKERLVYAAEYITDTLTDRNIEERLNKMVDARLKAKLGL